MYSVNGRNGKVSEHNSTIHSCLSNASSFSRRQGYICTITAVTYREDCKRSRVKYSVRPKIYHKGRARQCRAAKSTKNFMRLLVEYYSTTPRFVGVYCVPRQPTHKRDLCKFTPSRVPSVVLYIARCTSRLLLLYSDTGSVLGFEKTYNLGSM